MKLDILAALNAERAARRPVVLVTDAQSGEQRLVREEAFAQDPLADAIREAQRTGKSRLIETDETTVFLDIQVPPVRLVVIGAVHISQALCPMAELLPLAVTVIDPRTAFATPERFPGVDLIPEWPDTALGRLDRYTALAALTHDPKLDDPALIKALKAGCFYVGALGSRKSHAARVGRLTQAGLGDAEIGRIHAPIGLAIGSVSPAEIALSILAQLVATLRTDSGNAAP